MTLLLVGFRKDPFSSGIDTFNTSLRFCTNDVIDDVVAVLLGYQFSLALFITAMILHTSRYHLSFTFSQVTIKQTSYCVACRLIAADTLVLFRDSKNTAVQLQVFFDTHT